MAGIAHFAGAPSLVRPLTASRLAPLLRFVDQASGDASWRVELVDDAFEISRTVSRSSIVGEEDRDTLVSAGSALFMLRLAMRCNGMRPRIEYKMESSKQGVLARVAPIGTAIPTASDLALFAGGSHPGALLDPSALSEAASEEGTRLHVLPSSDLRKMVADCDPTARFDCECEAAAVICTTYDDPISWMIAGQSMRRLQLVAEDRGAELTILNSPLSVPGMKARFARESRFSSFPQVILTGFPPAR